MRLCPPKSSAACQGTLCLHARVPLLRLGSERPIGRLPPASASEPPGISPLFLARTHELRWKDAHPSVQAARIAWKAVTAALRKRPDRPGLRWECWEADRTADSPERIESIRLSPGRTAAASG